MKVPDNTLLMYFPAEHVNGMLAVFDLFIRANQKNETAVAAAKLNWQTAIQASRGAVALFDMQGRVMWKAKLPVGEADVRNAAAQVQGRKILQVNKQTWTIK